MQRWQLAQIRQSATLFLQSSKLGLPHPHTQESVYPPPPGWGGGGPKAWGGGGGGGGQ